MSTGSIESAAVVSQRRSQPGASLRGLDWRPVWAAVLTAAAYYLGAKLGLALTFHPHPISVLWPPNALLLAALLITPVRWWWGLLAAAFPAHLLAEMQDGVPTAMVLCWFVSNASEALIGATAVRWVTKGVPALDTMGDVAIFIACAAFLAPFLSSFLDAGFVVLNAWGQSGYWDIWRTRFIANTLSTLTLVPVIVTWSHLTLAGLRKERPGRWAEGGILAFGLLVTAAFVFEFQHATSSTLPPMLYLVLPFLLWAAFRFGTTGASAALLAIALMAIWGASHERGPFSSGSPLVNALAVQLFLSFVTVLVLSLAASMTERRGTERALRQSDERFQLVLRSTNAVIYDWDMVTDTLWWSPNGLKLFGYEPRDRLDNGWWVDLLHPEDREPVTSHFRSATDGGALWEAEYRLRRADGSYAWVHERGYILREQDRRPLRMIGTLMDITDHKRVEEINEELVHASRLAVLGELSASIAHEINQPLGAILSNADSAEMLLASNPPQLDELKQVIDDIRRDDMRAGEVIRRMRSLLRKQDLVMEPFDLNRAISDVLELVRTDLSRRGVEVTTRLNMLPIVHGDQVHVQQVVMNLVMNALEVMTEGAASKPRIDIVTGRSDDGQVQVTVADTGPGIGTEHRGRLFESFFTTKQNGMGLGLSIARSIVEAHGGRIWAENGVDGGAVFHFSIPVTATGRARDSVRMT